MQLSILFRSTLFCIGALTAFDVRADLSPKQTRKLIAHMAGFELPGSAVRVKRISSISAESAEATADIETALRLEKNGLGQWRVREIRTGPNQWEEIELIAAAIKAEVPPDSCHAHDLLAAAPNVAEPSVRRARCLVANLFNVSLPSDAVRIKKVSLLDVPLVSHPSALVVAVVRVELRLVNDGKNGWRVSELRSGNRDWANLETITGAVNEVKRKRGEAELASIAKALEAFRIEHGFYVASDKQPTLIDYLSPRYLSPIIRLDPWHRPYQYQGEGDHFTLRSTGPDGKENTADDIVLARFSR
jgi:hypothetical protein